MNTSLFAVAFYVLVQNWVQNCHCNETQQVTLEHSTSLCVP